MRISDCSSDVCSSDLLRLEGEAAAQGSDLVEGSGAADCPPRQGACQLLHVGLAMAAAERGRFYQPIKQQVTARRDADVRSEERRVGNECVSTERTWWAPYQ